MMTRASILALAAVLLGGCADNLRIVDPTVSRTPIVFESDVAASTFKEEVVDRYDSGDARIDRGGWKMSENAFFNLQIGVADGDSDGIITDLEATQYANVDN